MMFSGMAACPPLCFAPLSSFWVLAFSTPRLRISNNTADSRRSRRILLKLCRRGQEEPAKPAQPAQPVQPTPSPRRRNPRASRPGQTAR